MNDIKKYISDIFEYIPGIDYVPPELSGILAYSKEEMEKKIKSIDDMSKLEYWDEIFKIYNFLKDFLEKELQDFEIKFDPNAYPVLASAVRLMSNGKYNDTIDYEVFMNANNIAVYGMFNFIPPVHELFNKQIKVDIDDISKKLDIKLDPKLKEELAFEDPRDKFVKISDIVKEKIPPYLHKCFDEKRLSMFDDYGKMNQQGAEPVRSFIEYAKKYDLLTVGRMGWKMVQLFLLRLWIKYLKIVTKIFYPFKPVAKAISKWFLKRLHRIENDLFGHPVTPNVECPSYETWYKLKWIRRWQRIPWFIVKKSKKIDVCKEYIDPETGEVHPINESDFPQMDEVEDFEMFSNNTLSCIQAAQEILNFVFSGAK